jgi:AraC-like DNA-binding protein
MAVMDKASADSSRSPISLLPPPHIPVGSPQLAAQPDHHDFVNGYRVREVQRRITAGDARALKMLSLAMDAGFASKSTFNQVFKKHTSQTPSDFRQAAGA